MKRAREPRSNHPVQTGFLPNLRRAPDHQAGPPQELFPAVADLFVQRLWGIFRFSCRTERRQISSASNCSHLVPLQPGSHSRGGRTAYRNGASHYRSAANHLTLDFGVPTHHHVESKDRPEEVFNLVRFLGMKGDAFRSPVWTRITEQVVKDLIAGLREFEDLLPHRDYDRRARHTGLER